MQTVFGETLGHMLAVLGGATAVIAGLSTFLGKVWSARIVEKERAHSASILEVEKAQAMRELEFLRAQIQAERDKSNRVNDAQFALYSALWDKLQKLREEGDNLWQRAAPDTAESFGNALLDARAAINRGRLLLREEDFHELEGILASFGEYEVGKKSLIQMTTDELHQNAQGLDTQKIEKQIQENAVKRARYEQLLDQLVDHFRQQIRTST